MGPHPLGPVTVHVQATKGPDVNIMKFYTTQYGSSYGRENFSPRDGKHTGTGYKSNFRPGVYYNRKLDELDNPTMGYLIKDNYNSLTKIQFQPSRGSDGKDPFPKNVYLVKSGFVRDLTKTIPTSRQVKNICVDTRYQGTVYPPNRPLLRQLTTKDPVAAENSNYGPRYMSTENHTRFDGRQRNIDLSTRSVGRKEHSGFTHAYNDEPITYRPNEAYECARPGWMTYRPTGSSVMKHSFLPSAYAKGGEPFSTLSANSERNTGYTREIKPRAEFVSPNDGVFTKLADVHSSIQKKVQKDDPAEFTNMTYAKGYPSMTSATFKGKQRNDVSLPEKLGSLSIGRTEETGFTENNLSHIETAETPFSLKRFTTEYDVRYFDKNPQGNERRGNTKGNTHEQLENGFTKSTQVHSLGPQINTTKQLRQLHPYVARSIKARDPPLR